MKLDADQFAKYLAKKEKLILKAAWWADHGFINFFWPFRIRRLSMRIEALSRVLQGEK